MEHLLRPLFVISIPYTFIALPSFLGKMGGPCSPALLIAPVFVPPLITCFIVLFHSIKKATQENPTVKESLNAKVLVIISALIWSLLYLTSGLKLALIYSVPLLITIVLTFFKAFTITTVDKSK